MPAAIAPQKPQSHQQLELLHITARRKPCQPRANPVQEFSQKRKFLYNPAWRAAPVLQRMHRPVCGPGLGSTKRPWKRGPAWRSIEHRRCPRCSRRRPRRLRRRPRRPRPSVGCAGRVADAAGPSAAGRCGHARAPAAGAAVEAWGRRHQKCGGKHDCDQGSGAGGEKNLAPLRRLGAKNRSQTQQTGRFS